MEEDDLKINHHRDGVPLEPVYKESGNDAIDGDEADYLYKPKKRKKKKRSLKDYHKSPLNEPMKETPFDSHTSLKRIDYVLVYENKEIETLDKKERKKFEKNEKLRERFEQVLVNQEHLQIEKERVGEVTFLKIHCPFPRMSQEAESVHLEMPLREGAIPDDETHGSCYNYFVTDNEQDYVSASYETAKRHVFKGFEDPETFFRPALRSYLVNHMLINLDITENTDEKDEDTLRRKGLPYLLMKEAYTDAFILHDESPYEYYKRKKDAGEEVPTKEEFEKHAKAENIEDPRKELNDTWCRFTKFQPLWKIRNYFGEKIAFYFAWSGTLITTLWIPTLLGVAITLYGLYLSVEEYEAQKNQVFNSTANVTFNNTVGTTPASVVGELKNLGMDIYSIIKQSFDNSVTPYFSIVICLWGTLFLEIWKRTNARLAYEWDVDNYEFNEIDRPQFYGTKERVVRKKDILFKFPGSLI
uniref:Anoctamin n=1 Tax=Saccoglossus kowalevskii TaxID=10224 RepID=A0ABM0M917_SACKO|nr:PREDICTED: anoctamin-4-like [Saccoglossus kowalevskii]